MKYKVREYNGKDYDGIYKLLHDTYDSEVEADILMAQYSSGNRKILVAINQQDDMIIGCAFLEEMIDFIRPNKVLYVTYVAVEKNHRGMGIGKFIMENIEAIGKNLHCDALELTSANYRAGAHAFYKAIGFEKKETTHFIKELI